MKGLQFKLKPFTEIQILKGGWLRILGLGVAMRQCRI